jgi:uncharacterized protein YbcI
MAATQPDARAERSSVAAEVSREIVRLHARLFGRGPTRAKTFVYDDFALCILEDVLTRAEKTLVKAGNTEQVHATRMAFQEAVRPDFVALIEEITGRKVRAFVSQVHIEPELAAELFLFEPASGAQQELDAAIQEDGHGPADA